MAGYASAHGGTTTDVAIRSASLHRLTPQGVGALRDLGVRAVVDLRSDHELARDVTPDLASAGVRHVHAPVHDPATPPRDASWDFQALRRSTRSSWWRGRPPTARSSRRSRIRTARCCFTARGQRPHRRGGSGLLAARGRCPRRDIAEDYSHSQRLLEPAYATFRTNMEATNYPRRSSRGSWRRTPRHAGTIAHIEDEYGGGDGYLEHIV